MTIDDMKNFNDASWNSSEDIARKILELSNAPSESIGALRDAIYEIETIARNDYNKDYWRVLYNALDMIVDTTT